MVLNSYEDKDLVQNVEKVVEEAIQHYHESNEGSIIENDDSSGPSEVAMTQEDIVTINEDLSIIKLRKKALSVGLRTYQVSDKDEVCSSAKNYSLSGKTKDKKKSKESSTETQTKSVSPFVLYQGSYIRKSTALYLLQESCQVSSDCLMRVRSEQPSHIFVGTENRTGLQDSVKSGVLVCMQTGFREHEP